MQSTDGYEMDERAMQPIYSYGDYSTQPQTLVLQLPLGTTQLPGQGVGIGSADIEDVIAEKNVPASILISGFSLNTYRLQPLQMKNIFQTAYYST
jgi:hypothetical protein